MYMSGLSDEAGAGAGLAMAIKQARPCDRTSIPEFGLDEFQPC